MSEAMTCAEAVRQYRLRGWGRVEWVEVQAIAGDPVYGSERCEITVLDPNGQQVLSAEGARLVASLLIGEDIDKLLDLAEASRDWEVGAPAHGLHEAIAAMEESHADAG